MLDQDLPQKLQPVITSYNRLQQATTCHNKLQQATTSYNMLQQIKEAESIILREINLL